MKRGRSYAGAFTTIGGLVALVGGLAIVDERVRAELARLLHGNGPSVEVSTASMRLQDMTAIVLQAVKDQSIEHAPLTIFAMGAMVLVLFMSRVRM